MLRMQTDERMLCRTGEGEADQLRHYKPVLRHGFVIGQGGRQGKGTCAVPGTGLALLHKLGIESVIRLVCGKPLYAAGALIRARACTTKGARFSQTARPCRTDAGCHLAHTCKRTAVCKLACEPACKLAC